jgi:hypothetical protein
MVIGVTHARSFFISYPALLAAYPM